MTGPQKSKKTEQVGIGMKFPLFDSPLRITISMNLHVFVHHNIWMFLTFFHHFCYWKI